MHGHDGCGASVRCGLGNGTEGSCNGTGKEWMCWEGG